MIFHVTLKAIPRTKKTHNRVFPMISSEGLKSLVKRLQASVSHRDSIKALMSEISFSVHPSEGFEEWFNLIYPTRFQIQSELAALGVKLPILEPVAISALIYREADRGDWTGYVDAIADAIQAELWQCQLCRKKTMVLAGCPSCRASIAAMRHARKGLGIIGDDRQIEHWDGTRLMKDSTRPRIELTVRTLAAPQASLFERQEEEVSV